MSCVCWTLRFSQLRCPVFVELFSSWEPQSCRENTHSYSGNYPVLFRADNTVRSSPCTAVVFQKQAITKTPTGLYEKKGTNSQIWKFAGPQMFQTCTRFLPSLVFMRFWQLKSKLGLLPNFSLNTGCLERVSDFWFPGNRFLWSS